MPRGWLMIWFPADVEDRAENVIQMLSWTRGHEDDGLHLSSGVVAWPLSVPVSTGMLADLAGALHYKLGQSWSIAIVPTLLASLTSVLPEFNGEILVDERIVQGDVHLHWDHPRSALLHELELGLWSRGPRRHEASEDQSEPLKEMRSVPRSPDDRITPRQITVRIPTGVSPAEYAGIAYSDVPDGSEEHNGVGGRNVLLFHSAMRCNQPPFDANNDSKAFTFLNAPASEVKYFKANQVSHNFIDHILDGKISVEQVIGGSRD